MNIPGRSVDDNEEAEEDEDDDEGYSEEVNIPGRSVDDNEEAEEDEDDDEGYSEEEEDEGKNSEDHRMMDGDEGGMSLPDDDDVEVYSPEQTGMEDFERVSSLVTAKITFEFMVSSLLSH